MFAFANANDVLQKTSDYSDFNPVIYSLDCTLPIINLHSEKYWEPRLSSDAWTWFYWLYLRLHIVLGWIFTTLGVVGFTGVVRKE